MVPRLGAPSSPRSDVGLGVPAQSGRALKQKLIDENPSELDGGERRPSQVVIIDDREESKEQDSAPVVANA
ncbi:MAG: hypothetical protein U1A28_00410, partial [Patescibacteria group bacterium]|nr:hypothetical protein [Patescibacteria group bacterium]